MDINEIFFFKFKKTMEKNQATELNRDGTNCWTQEDLRTMVASELH